MALAEARAAWQRTGNRCLVQEDAKRAPKLACCSSLPPSAKQAETGPTNAPGVQDTPSSGSLPVDRNPSCSNLSPNSRWWLQLQPNYVYQKGLMDEQLTSVEGNKETYRMQESSGDSARSEDGFRVISRTFVTCEKKDFTVEEEKFTSFDNMNCNDPFKIKVAEYFDELKCEGFVNCEVLKNGNDHCFSSESPWIRAEKNTPWWRTADTEELALLIAQQSHELIENNDLPRPQSTHIKKDRSVNMNCFAHNEISTSLTVRKPGIGSHHHQHTERSSFCKLSISAEDRLVPGSNKPSWLTLERLPEKHALEDDASKLQLLEALRHSQTRAREADKVAKQANAEKEHVVKLVLRQASQLFAYKQWLHLLQLENMYFQFKNNKTQTMLSPGTTQQTRKIRKGWQKSSSRRRAKRCRPWYEYDAGKYAIVFALGLGLVGAGLLLGWSIGWMLSMW